jgi:lipid II:glycine glycyltransferase (peptidoglycan interpeptide bridge formation enzyme)
LDELRACLRPHWRRELKNAEKHRLEIVEGTDEALFRTFVSIYREMVARKNFREPNKIEQFVAMQSRLPERFKARILLCQSEGAVCAGLVTSVAGNTAIYLFGATGDAGLKASGAHLLQWRFIEALNRSGIPTYDLNGINPVNNPGTYRFKAELCGNAGRDTYFLGRYDTHPGMVSRSCVAFGKRIMAASRIIRACAQAKPTVKRQEGAR